MLRTLIAILLILMGMFVIDALSIAYTWGFCVIYATALQSLTGRQGRDWMLPSLGFTILGRWVGPAVISLLMGVVSSFIVFPLLVFDGTSGVGTGAAVFIFCGVATGELIVTVEHLGDIG
jgi:hypothetical protein